MKKRSSENTVSLRRHGPQPRIVILSASEGTAPLHCGETETVVVLTPGAACRMRSKLNWALAPAAQPADKVF